MTAKLKVLGALASKAAKVREKQRRRGEELLALIERRKARIVEDFYEIGVALRELLQHQLYLAMGHKSFGEFLESRGLISRSQAAKLIEVATAFPRELALRLGLEKAYGLVRYVAATPAPDVARILAEKNARIAGKALDRISVRELSTATRVVLRERAGGRASRDPEHRAALALARRLAAHAGKEASVIVHQSHGAYWLRVDLPAAHAHKLLP